MAHPTSGMTATDGEDWNLDILGNWEEKKRGSSDDHPDVYAPATVLNQYTAVSPNSGAQKVIAWDWLGQMRTNETAGHLDNATHRYAWDGFGRLTRVYKILGPMSESLIATYRSPLPCTLFVAKNPQGATYFGQQVSYTATGSCMMFSYSVSGVPACPSSGSGPSFSTQYAGVGHAQANVSGRTSGADSTEAVVASDVRRVCDSSGPGVGVVGQSVCFNVPAPPGTVASWSAPGGSPANGLGGQFCTTFGDVGTFQVAVQVGIELASCSLSTFCMSPGSSSIRIDPPPPPRRLQWRRLVSPVIIQSTDGRTVAATLDLPAFRQPIVPCPRRVPCPSPPCRSMSPTAARQPGLRDPGCWAMESRIRVGPRQRCLRR